MTDYFCSHLGSTRARTPGRSVRGPRSAACYRPFDDSLGMVTQYIPSLPWAFTAGVCMLCISAPGKPIRLLLRRFRNQQGDRPMSCASPLRSAGCCLVVFSLICSHYVTRHELLAHTYGCSLSGSFVVVYNCFVASPQSWRFTAGAIHTSLFVTYSGSLCVNILHSPIYSTQNIP